MYSVLDFVVRLKVFIHHFDDMTMKQQHVVFKNFVLVFLSHSGTLI